MRQIIWMFVIASPVIALARSTHAVPDVQSAQLAAHAATAQVASVVHAICGLLT
jgi:hypothetical protein